MEFRPLNGLINIAIEKFTNRQTDGDFPAKSSSLNLFEHLALDDKILGLGQRD